MIRARNAARSVLFLCTANSARSILAEAILNRIGGPDWRAFSAGSHPRGRVHPIALDLLAEHGERADAFRSKSWDEFAAPNAPALDLVITVCDDAAAESCPVFPASPVTAHWGLPDPAAAPPEARRAAFERTWRELERRIAFLTKRAAEASLDAPEPGVRRDRIERIAEASPNAPEDSQT
jgi:arsenate reductase